MKVQIVAAMGLLLVASACKKEKPPAPPPDPPPAPAVEKAPEPEMPKTEEKAREIILKNFERVHFETDSSELSGGSLDALEANAKILQEFANLSVEVQGHADERGTTDYNLALGQRRAQSVKSYLGKMGVTESRISVISYGEERPLRDASWSQNRRAEFRVLTSTPEVKGTTE